MIILIKNGTIFTNSFNRIENNRFSDKKVNFADSRFPRCQSIIEVHIFLNVPLFNQYSYHRYRHFGGLRFWANQFYYFLYSLMPFPHLYWPSDTTVTYQNVYSLAHLFKVESYDILYIFVSLSCFRLDFLAKTVLNDAAMT